MPRVKKSVASRARRKKWLGMAKGFRSRPAAAVSFRPGGRGARPDLRLPGPQGSEAGIPRPVDRPHQRRLAAAGDVLQQIHRRAEKGRDQSGPQGPGRPGSRRPSGLRPGCRHLSPGPVRLWSSVFGSQFLPPFSQGGQGGLNNRLIIPLNPPLRKGDFKASAPRSD